MRKTSTKFIRIIQIYRLLKSVAPAEYIANISLRLQLRIVEGAIFAIKIIIHKPNSIKSLEYQMIN